MLLAAQPSARRRGGSGGGPATPSSRTSGAGTATNEPTCVSALSRGRCAWTRRERAAQRGRQPGADPGTPRASSLSQAAAVAELRKGRLSVQGRKDGGLRPTRMARLERLAGRVATWQQGLRWGRPTCTLGGVFQQSLLAAPTSGSTPKARRAGSAESGRCLGRLSVHPTPQPCVETECNCCAAQLETCDLQVSIPRNRHKR